MEAQRERLGRGLTLDSIGSLVRGSGVTLGVNIALNACIALDGPILSDGRIGSFLNDLVGMKVLGGRPLGTHEQGKRETQGHGDDGADQVEHPMLLDE